MRNFDMEKSILLILVGDRAESAVKVQKILTEKGCFIKTRLGIHDSTPEECVNSGFIILELIGSDEQKRELVEKLKQVPKVKVTLVEMSL
jgi:hypothetical protein